MHGKLRIGVHRGGGPPPGYQWNLLVVTCGYNEVMKFLNASQYEHLAEQFRELARQGDPTRSQTISIDAIENFHELRDKGGVLCRINARIFFYVDHATRSIVVVGGIDKKNDGATPHFVKITMRGRVRMYVQGKYGAARLKSGGTTLRTKGKAGP